MRILVLGGTHHVGRAVSEEAVARGHDVTNLNRGRSGRAADGVERLVADRLDPGSMAEALRGRDWDLVLDTWSHAPAAVLTAARLLAGHAAAYHYVSSRSVYAWPIPENADESAPVVEADPASTRSEDYAAAKRGGELAVEQAFDGRRSLLRAGLILGPWENVGRLPFWLERIARGDRVPAPGPHDRPLQVLDARDLAAFVLDHDPEGTFNLTGPAGHTTIGELLDACVVATGSGAELVWLDPDVVERSGVEPWTELPIWVPPTGELAALHSSDVSRALAAGFRARPATETVADTWAWMGRAGVPDPATTRAGTGMDAEAEGRLWAAAG
jgi:nucleoside-diphosphate-sugar epimerase